jgi:hypothetical protein
MPTKHADICLKKFIEENKEKKLVNYSERVDHDGYDREGPKSNLWDLYVFYQNSRNEMMVDFYHREDWFSGKEEEYSLWGTYTLSDFKYGEKVWCANNRKICEKIGL